MTVQKQRTKAELSQAFGKLMSAFILICALLSFFSSLTLVCLHPTHYCYDTQRQRCYLLTRDSRGNYAMTHVRTGRSRGKRRGRTPDTEAGPPVQGLHGTIGHCCPKGVEPMRSFVTPTHPNTTHTPLPCSRPRRSGAGSRGTCRAARSRWRGSPCRAARGRGGGRSAPGGRRTPVARFVFVRVCFRWSVGRVISSSGISFTAWKRIWLTEHQEPRASPIRNQMTWDGKGRTSHQFITRLYTEGGRGPPAFGSFDKQRKQTRDFAPIVSLWWLIVRFLL